MKHFGAAAFLVSIILAAASGASAKEWNGIVPLKSTRADVERLLGEGSNDNYRYGRQIVDIGYAQFPCGHKSPPGWPEAPPGWNVPRDTVVSVRVSLGVNTVRLNSLSYDLANFQRVRGDHDLPQHFYYTDNTEGFAIEFFDFSGADQIVSAFLYAPTVSEERLFRCKD